MKIKNSPLASLSVFTLLCCGSLTASSFNNKDSGNSSTPASEKASWASQKIKPTKVKIDLRSLKMPQAWRSGDEIKDIPRRRFKPNYVKPGAPKNPVQSRTDSLMKIQNTIAANDTRDLRAVELQFDGAGYSGVNPPDTTGDVGLNYYIQSINGSSGSIFNVYDKVSGNLVAGPTSMESLGSGNCATGAGDPIVLYDEMADRWLLSEFSSFGNYLCVYISQTSDPVTGGWYAYSFVAPSFPDYPKYGVGVDAYYVGTNETTSAVYALDRDAMLAGNSAAMVRLAVADLAGFGFQMIQPADHEGSTAMPAGTPGYFLRHRDDEVHNSGANNPTEDYVELWQFDVDFVNTASSSFTKVADFPVAEFDSDLCGLFSFSCFPQAGSGTTLDPLREVVMFRAQYRNFGSYETIVGNFVTDVDGTDHGGVRWFELRRTAGTWSLFQEGTYAPDAKNRWMGSIAMDKDGNIALAYSYGSSSDFPGIRYTGRLANDATGVMTQAETTLVVGTSSNASNRWGDYSHLALDPADECTFWYTNQYGRSGGQWGTHIASFKFDSCGSGGGNISPVASFTVSCNDLICDFDGSASSDSDGTVDAYSWDFGDGASNTGSSPTHTYATAGTYTVTLTVTDNEGATGNTSQTFVAGTVNQDPQAGFTFAASELSVDFTDTSSDSDGTITSWSWDFGDGNSSTQQNPTNLFASSGTYSVSLTVTDDDGATSTDTQDVTVSDSTVTSGGFTETNVAFTSGQNIIYTIDVPANADSLVVDTSGGTGNVDLVINFGSTPTRTDNDCIQTGAGNTHNCTIDNPAEGTWFILVRGQLTSSGVQVDAYWFASGGGNSAPTADFSFSANQLAVTFTDNSSDSDGSVVAWAWDFGDGNSSTAQNPQHTYSASGTYSATLTVTDDQGASNSSTQSVVVTDGGATTGGWTETNVSPAQGQVLSYTIDVPAGAATLEVDTSGGSGNVDIAIRFGATPTASVNDCIRIGAGNVHNCTIINPQVGTWFIVVRGAQASSGVQLDAYWAQ